MPYGDAVKCFPPSTTKRLPNLGPIKDYQRPDPERGAEKATTGQNGDDGSGSGTVLVFEAFHFAAPIEDQGAPDDTDDPRHDANHGLHCGLRAVHARPPGIRAQADKCCQTGSEWPGPGRCRQSLAAPSQGRRWPRGHLRNQNRGGDSPARRGRDRGRSRSGPVLRGGVRGSSRRWPAGGGRAGFGRAGGEGAATPRALHELAVQFHRQLDHPVTLRTTADVDRHGLTPQGSGISGRGQGSGARERQGNTKYLLAPITLHDRTPFSGTAGASTTATCHPPGSWPPTG